MKQTLKLNDNIPSSIEPNPSYTNIISISDNYRWEF